MKTLNDYFTMNYRMEIVEDKDEGGFRDTSRRRNIRPEIDWRRGRRR